MKLTVGTFVVAAICLAGCSKPQSPDVADSVRASLNNANLKDVSVSQDRDKGVVTLGGDVKSDAEKERAESIAKTGAPGQVVVNEIAITRPDTPDPWVTMKTKISLITADDLSTSDLNVDTVNGVVTLHGKVPTEAEKAKAESVARGVEGAKEVRNMLQVVSSAQRKVVERSDDLVEKGVKDAFDANRRIADSGVKVASVNKGVVLLSGKTSSMEAYLESVEVANAVRGVRRVSTEVEVVPGS